MTTKGDRIEERVYKSLWHVMIAGVGIYELKHQKSLFSKILATGLIAFHVDAAIADALDIPPLARRILESVRPEIDEKPVTNPKRTEAKGKRIRK